MASVNNQTGIITHNKKVVIHISSLGLRIITNMSDPQANSIEDIVKELNKEFGSDSSTYHVATITWEEQA